MMSVQLLYLCFIGLFLCSLALEQNVGSVGSHRLFKRQTTHVDRTSGTNSAHIQPTNSQTSGTFATGQNSGRSRSFVSSDGQPYHEYRPHVSTSRVSGTGHASSSSSGSTRDRASTAHVSVGGRGTAGRAVVDGSVRSRSRTYTYPFGHQTSQYQHSAGTHGTSGMSGSGHQGSVTGTARGGSSHSQTLGTGDAGRGSSHYQTGGTGDAGRGSSHSQTLGTGDAGRGSSHSQTLGTGDAGRGSSHYHTGGTRDAGRGSSHYQTGGTGDAISPGRTSTTVTGNGSVDTRRRIVANRRHHTEHSQGQSQRTGYEARTASGRRQPGSVTDSRSSQDRGHQGTASTHHHNSETRTSQRNTGTSSSSSGSAGGNQQRISSTQYDRRVYNPANRHSRTRTSTSYQQSGTGRNPTGQGNTYYSRVVPNRRQPSTNQGRTQPSQYSGHRTNSQTVYTSATNQRPGFRATLQQVHPSSNTGSSQGYHRRTGHSQATHNYPGSNSHGQYSSGSQSYPQAPNVYNPQATGTSYGGCPETGIDLRISGMSCEQAVQTHGSFLCYAHEYTSRQCCEVCRPRRQSNRIGCEYGDHAQQCNSINASDCYDLRNRQTCCETCERLRIPNAPPGCEYGDMTSHCSTVRQNSGMCYIPDNQRLCCQSCRQVRNDTNPSCPYGDFNSELCQLFDEGTPNVRINCYSHHRRRLCCQSCERLRDWIPDDVPGNCQYGDRPVVFNTDLFGHLNCSNVLHHFSTSECRTNPAVSVNCCFTCYRNARSRA